jgi:hypothetical protein
MTTLPRIQHVSIHRPSGEEATRAARAFYGNLVGLPEIDVPETLTGRGLIWYQLATRNCIFSLRILSKVAGRSIIFASLSMM